MILKIVSTLWKVFLLRYVLFFFFKFTLTYICLFICYAAKNAVETNDQAAPHTQNPVSDTNSLFGCYNEKRPQSASPSKILEELEEFLKEPTLDIDRPESLPLAFWKKNKDRFKIISYIALEIFCIPASSGNIERVFSVAKDILSAKRTKMKSILFKRILFIRRNYFLLNS